MTRFIMIPVDEIDAFSETYFKETEEKIQSNPPMNKEETHYLVGSFRLNRYRATKLKGLFPNVTIGKTRPAWEIKEERE